MQSGFSLWTECTGVCTWQFSGMVTLQVAHLLNCHDPVRGRVSSMFYYIHALNYPSQIKSSDTLNKANVLLTYFRYIYTEQVEIIAMSVQGGACLT